MKHTRCTLLLILFMLCLNSLSWALTRNHLDLSEDAVRRKWKVFHEIKDSIQVQGNYPHMKCFKETARKYNISLPLLLAVGRGESNFDKMAKSNRDCYGIMQIQWPRTANDLGIMKKKELFDPCINIDAGGKYLSQLLKQFNGDTFLALAAYNYGPNRINKELRKGSVPEGARWYANYIHDHLKFVRTKTYTETGRVLVFEYSYYNTALRNQKFYETMAPGITFEIFKSSHYTYDLYIIHQPGQRHYTIRKFMKNTGIEPLEERR